MLFDFKFDIAFLENTLFEIRNLIQPKVPFQLFPLTIFSKSPYSIIVAIGRAMYLEFFYYPDFLF